MNQHRLRFVPQAETAVWTLSHGASGTEAGGEVWETPLPNFVQAQPYLDE